jgi:hypothetical protein
MYLYIFEDGEAKKATTFGEGDKEACDDGILEVIRISDCKTYHEGDWHDLESADV